MTKTLQPILAGISILYIILVKQVLLTAQLILNRTGMPGTNFEEIHPLLEVFYTDRHGHPECHAASMAKNLNKQTHDQIVQNIHGKKGALEQPIAWTEAITHCPLHTIQYYVISKAVTPPFAEISSAPCACANSDESLLKRPLPLRTVFLTITGTVIRVTPGKTRLSFEDNYFFSPFFSWSLHARSTGHKQGFEMDKMPPAAVTT